MKHSKSLLFLLFCRVESENRKVQKLNRVEEVSGDNVDLGERVLVVLILVLVSMMNIVMALKHFDNLFAVKYNKQHNYENCFENLTFICSQRFQLEGTGNLEPEPCLLLTSVNFYLKPGVMHLQKKAFS